MIVLIVLGLTCVAEKKRGCSGGRVDNLIHTA